MEKKFVKIFISGMIMLLMVGIISAFTEIESIPENIPFSFTSWFKHTFRIQDFSIVGQDRHCDVYVKEGNTLYFYPNGENILMDIDVSNYCSSGHGLIDIFVNNWNPFMEYKDSVTRYCGFGDDQCIAEIYCCDHDECTSDSQCESWEGTGSECEKKIANDLLIDYEFTYYYHCTVGCTDPDITCWREEGGVCVSRTYDCSYGTYPNCPTTYKYTSKSECEDNIPTNGNGEEIDCTDFKKESDCLAYDECDWVDADSWIIDKHCVIKEENGNGNGDGITSKTLTWSEFYSISDDEFYKNNYYCKSDSECPSKENYEVSCVGIGDESVSKLTDRDMKVIREKCDKGLGFLDELLNIAKSIFPGFSALPNLCDGISEGVLGFKRALAGEGNYAGYCLAESTTWYGKLWDGTLKTVGGMGFPAQYVMVITIMLLITIIGFGVRMFT